MEQRHGRHAQLLYLGAWAFVGAGPGGLEGVDGRGRHLRAAVNGGEAAIGYGSGARRGETGGRSRGGGVGRYAERLGRRWKLGS